MKEYNNIYVVERKDGFVLVLVNERRIELKKSINPSLVEILFLDDDNEFIKIPEGYEVKDKVQYRTEFFREGWYVTTHFHQKPYYYNRYFVTDYYIKNGEVIGSENTIEIDNYELDGVWDMGYRECIRCANWCKDMGLYRIANVLSFHLFTKAIKHDAEQLSIVYETDRSPLNSYYDLVNIKHTCNITGNVTSVCFPVPFLSLDGMRDMMLYENLSIGDRLTHDRKEKTSNSYEWKVMIRKCYEFITNLPDIEWYYFDHQNESIPYDPDYVEDISVGFEDLQNQINEFFNLKNKALSYIENGFSFIQSSEYVKEAEELNNDIHDFLISIQSDAELYDNYEKAINLIYNPIWGSAA